MDPSQFHWLIAEILQIQHSLSFSLQIGSIKLALAMNKKEEKKLHAQMNNMLLIKLHPAGCTTYIVQKLEY